MNSQIGLKDEQFSEIRKRLTKDAGYILHAVNSETGHLGDVISGLKTTVSSIELKIETLKKIFNDSKNKES